MYSVVDLFAGAGGLSLGFKQTHKFDVKVAFENNPAMQKTYEKNHSNTEVLGDVCAADYTDIMRKYGKIDVVIGGPPCQGFSNANRQKNHAINHNNMLVKQYLRAVLELQPKAFVMENVSMLRSDVHRFYLDDKDVELFKQYSVPMANARLTLLDSEYVFDGALDIIQSETQIKKYRWEEERYSIMNVLYKATKAPKKLENAIKKHGKTINSYLSESERDDRSDHILHESYVAHKGVAEYLNGSISADRLKELIEPSIMIQRMLGKAQEIFDNHIVVERYEERNGLHAIIKSYAVFDYIKAILESEPNNYALTSGVLCAADYGAPQKRMRFVIVGIKKGYSERVSLPEGTFKVEDYRTVRDAIFDLECVKTITDTADDEGIIVVPSDDLSDLAKQLKDSPLVFNHLITNTRETAMERFRALKPGQNFHSLDDSLKTNTYSDVSRTQNTIYQRLDYDKPSGTVLNVRKSMWVHPSLNRAISVREAARLQTFPDSFIFCGTKDKQYQQVGNAVPPLMAKAIAETLATLLDQSGTGTE